MTDLVSRLRVDYFELKPAFHALMRKAADEIEQLTRENADLRKAVAGSRALLTQVGSAAEPSGDAAKWLALMADVNAVPCKYPCLRDDLHDWLAATADEPSARLEDYGVVVDESAPISEEAWRSLRTKR